VHSDEYKDELLDDLKDIHDSVAKEASFLDKLLLRFSEDDDNDDDDDSSSLDRSKSSFEDFLDRLNGDQDDTVEDSNSDEKSSIEIYREILGLPPSLQERPRSSSHKFQLPPNKIELSDKEVNSNVNRAVGLFQHLPQIQRQGISDDKGHVYFISFENSKDPVVIFGK